MVSLTFGANVDEVIAALTDVEKKQVPIAIVWALNDMADEVLAGVQSDMDKHFDRPTKYTKNAFMVWRARKSTLFAEVKERPSVSSRHYLKVEERGGVRPMTGMEKAFQTRMPFHGIVQSVIPASGALRDVFGNWKSSERNRVMAAVKAQSDRQSNSSKASKVRNRNQKQFFVPREGSKLSPGVWKRTSRKATLVKVLSFSDTKPRYKPRLGFVEGATARVQKEFPTYFSRSLAKALATARPQSGSD